MPGKLQGGGVLWQGVQVHAEEIHGELPVEVMEFVFIYAMFLIQMFFINPGKVMQIEGALGIDTFVQAKEFPVLFRDEGVSAVRADEADRRGDTLPRDECLATDLAQILSVATIVIIEIMMRGTTEGADNIFRDRLPVTALDRSDGFAILPEKVFEEELPVLFDEGLDDGEPVSGKLLVFGGVGIIESPLLERNISADEVQEPANGFILFLNYSK